MTALAPTAHMTFGGTSQPACDVEVKNIGQLQPSAAESLSATLCAQLSQALDVDDERIYIELTDATGPLWGWNGSTFG